MITEYDNIISAAAVRYDVPETWIKAVIGVESGFNALAYRAEPRLNDGSYGLMQLLFRTAKGLGYTGAPEGLFDPAANIDLGSKLLGQLIARYGLDFARVYSAYNSGSPDKYLTSSQVAQHVENAVEWLKKASVEANTGVIAIAIIILLLIFRR